MAPLISHYLAVSKSLLRTPTYLLLCLYFFVGLLTALYPESVSTTQISWLFILRLSICLLVIALWYMNGTALNDYADYEIDLINLKNDKDRPLVVGISRRQELMNLGISYAITAVGLSLFLSIWHTLCLLVLLFMNFAYSLKPLQISRRGGIAPLLLPLGYVALPFLLGHGLTDWTLSSLDTAILGALYLQFAGRIILKDYRDVKGDAAYGKMTFLLRYGNAAVCIVSALCIAASCMVLFKSFDNSSSRFSTLLLTGYALMILYELSQTHSWAKQKPLLAAFGRSMTGVTVLLIFTLISTFWGLQRLEIQAVSVIITLVYIWSAHKAFLYNRSRYSSVRSGK